MRNKAIFIVMLLGVVVVLIGSCKKENTGKTLLQAVDFRDSLVGSYACMAINSSWTPTGGSADTAKDTVMVAKSGDSSLIISGTAFSFAVRTQGSTGSYQFTGPVTNAVSCQNEATFATNGSNIYWYNECQTVSTSSSVINQGSKIH